MCGLEVRERPQPARRKSASNAPSACGRGLRLIYAGTPQEEAF